MLQTFCVGFPLMGTWFKTTFPHQVHFSVAQSGYFIPTSHRMISSNLPWKQGCRAKMLPPQPLTVVCDWRVTSPFQSLPWQSNTEHFEKFCPQRAFFIFYVYLNWKDCIWNRILYHLSQRNTTKKEQGHIHLQAFLLQFQYKRHRPITKLIVFYLSKYSRVFLG